VVADAFVSVYLHRDQLDPDRPFKPWLMRIVTNQALSVARRDARAARVLSLLGRRPVSAPDPVEQAELGDLRRQVVAAVRALTPDQRVAIALRYFEDMDERSMVELLGWPAGTVKTRLHRARAALRVRLAELRHRWACSPTGGS
jgi:RNA polymerase sigma-70 factor (ECF subfamily)